MQKMSTKVQTVKIFRRGAEVIRQGSIELPAGSSTVCIGGFSQSADPDTLQLYVSEGLSCTDYRLVNPDPEGEESPETAAIRKKIRELEQQAGIREMQISLLQTNGNFTGREEQDLAGIFEYIEILPERLQKFYTEAAECRDEIRELEKQAEKQKEAEQRPFVSAEISADAAGEYLFELHYHENAAGWQPVYEIHTDREGPLEIRMRAKIFQNTEEDWKAAAVSLYSGTPAVGRALPELKPVYLEIREEQPIMKAAMGMNMMQAQMMGMGMAMAGAAPAPMARMETGAAEVRSEETMTEYLLPGTRDIPKGSSSAMADLQKYTVPAVYRIISIPKADPSAHLIAEVNTSELPEIETASAGVYLKGMYSGKAELPKDLSKETVRIGLGIEKQIHVSRREVSRKTSTTLLKGQKITEYIYEMKLSNLSGEKVTVTLWDQVPVSRTKDITVETGELSGSTPDPETGLISWEKTVEAGEPVLIRFSYKVSLPKDKQLNQTFAPAGNIPKFCPECGAVTDGSRFCNTCGAKLG